ncbi:MAG: Asp-tRNA(Asn)/Glu-tRNA(Gln) amidotransferase subunit GatC [Deltaproteobacteria bacterium]|nr:Asp-tRNA(Asn)/Glu-tRNA(Gln) amidotransferase subunit GatC [Deltaproteobacteria bacterium]
MPITKKDVEHVAELARLALTEEEKELYTGQLQRILDYVETLSGVNTRGVPPTTYTVPERKAVRADTVIGSIPQEDALSNAPEKAKGCFRVPRIIE